MPLKVGCFSVAVRQIVTRSLVLLHTSAIDEGADLRLAGRTQ
jgi:hypothetical protein